MKPVYSSRLLVVPSSVGWVSQFYDTRWVQFSQSNLQKGLVLLKRKFKIFFTLNKGITFIKKIQTDSHNFDSQKFENSWLSFVGSHKPGIT